MDIDTASAIGIFYGLASEYGLTAAPLNRDESEVWHDVTIDGKVRLRFVIVAACVLAAWVPASRASKVDPIRALRQE